MNLQSTTDFVLWLRSLTTTELHAAFPGRFHKGNINTYVSDTITNDAILWRFAGNHAKFVKKPVSLGIFVPCDNNGQPLLKPTWAKCKGDRDFQNKSEIYMRAEKNVLFEGFYMGKNFEDKTVLLHQDRAVNVFGEILTDGRFRMVYPRFAERIQDLIDQEFPAVLTENAIKLITI